MNNIKSKDAWEKLYGKELSDADVLEINTNVTNLINLICNTKDLNNDKSSKRTKPTN